MGVGGGVVAEDEQVLEGYDVTEEGGANGNFGWRWWHGFVVVDGGGGQEHRAVVVRSEV